MQKYEDAKIKLTNTQLNKSKSTAERKIERKTLTIKKENFQNEELSDELDLTIKQETKIRSAFANKMSVDIKFSIAKLPKINELGRFFYALFGKLAN